MYKNLLKILPILLLTGCSSEKEETTSPPNPDPEPPIVEETYSYTVNATFFKGLVAGATCELNKVEEGVEGEVLLTKNTNNLGVVTFENVNHQGQVLISCEGGSYIDEATERQVTNELQVRSVTTLEGEEETPVDIVLTPLTEMSVRLVELSEDNLTAIENYNSKVSVAFGLGELNIATTKPLDLLNNVISEDREDAAYAFSIALLTGVLENQDETRPLTQIMTDYTLDLNSRLLNSETTFSDTVKIQLGKSADFFLSFGSLVNSSLQQTRVRQDLIAAAGIILPEANGGEIITDSLREPLDQLRLEIAEYILGNELEELPAAPPVTDAMFDLGQALAFDKILSGNKDTSCLSCHHPLLATGDNRSLPLGTGGKNLGQDRVDGLLVPRHAPALFNLDLFKKMFWDGRVEFKENGDLSTPADSTGDITPEMESVFFAKEAENGFQGYGLVAAQAMFPVTSHEEMKGDPKEGNELAHLEGNEFKEIWEALMLRLGAIPEYVEMFEAAYPNVKFEDMTFAHAANAIAGFEIRAFDFRKTPWQGVVKDVLDNDTWDNTDLLTENQTRGAHFFFETGCINCHKGSTMSDFDFHNLSTAQFGHGKGDGQSGYEDFGRERVTGNIEHRTAFRTSPLLNVQLTPPYGHLGQFKDLESHIQIYAIPERFWLNIYTGFDRVRNDFVHVPTFEEQIKENEKVLLKQIPLPSHDGEKHGFIKTVEYNEEKILKVINDKGRLTQEAGKQFGADGELGQQRRILVQFMNAQTDPRARRLERLIPDSVPSGLPVEKELIEE